MWTTLRIAVLALAACSSSSSGVARDADVRLDGLDCIAAAPCTTGPTCGTTCCGSGESCISGVCTCGSQPACTDGNMCVSPLAMMNGCGNICCGATLACPGVGP